MAVNMKHDYPMPRPGMRLIFRPYITHKATGRRIYPKRARYFPLWVEA